MTLRSVLTNRVIKIAKRGEVRVLGLQGSVITSGSRLLDAHPVYEISSSTYFALLVSFSSIWFDPMLA